MTYYIENANNGCIEAIAGCYEEALSIQNDLYYGNVDTYIRQV
jgi:predicted transcriptional regulator